MQVIPVNVEMFPNISGYHFEFIISYQFPAYSHLITNSLIYSFYSCENEDVFIQERYMLSHVQYVCVEPSVSLMSL